MITTNAVSRRMVVTSIVAASAGHSVLAAPPPHPMPGFEFAFEAIVEIASATNPGPTPYGGRGRVPITGGEFAGPRIRGRVVPGGADWQLRRADGTMTLDADYMLETDDGALIHIHNHGVVSGKPGGADFYLRTVPEFEAPIGPHDWLNKAVFIGTVEGVPGRDGKAVRIRVFKVT